MITLSGAEVFPVESTTVTSKIFSPKAKLCSTLHSIIRPLLAAFKEKRSVGTCPFTNMNSMSKLSVAIPERVIVDASTVFLPVGVLSVSWTLGAAVSVTGVGVGLGDWTGVEVLPPPPPQDAMSTRLVMNRDGNETYFVILFPFMSGIGFGVILPRFCFCCYIDCGRHVSELAPNCTVLVLSGGGGRQEKLRWHKGFQRTKLNCD